jgi:hypothetical protein
LKKIIIILSLFSIVSCQFFEQKKAPTANELLEQRLKEIDWKTLDQLPLVFGCENITDKNEQKKCFFYFFTKTVNQKINADTLAKLYPNRKVLIVKVSIFPNESIRFESIVNDSLSATKQKIDSILKLKLINFPSINPALKRGIPVKVQFVIPVKLTK